VPTASTPLPKELAAEPFSTHAATRAGLTPGRLRAGDLTAPYRGVRVPGPAADGLLGRCRALLQVLPDGARFSHLTALALVGLDRPWGIPEEDRLHVEVSTSSTRPRIRGVVAHRHAGIAPVIDVHGVPTLDPAWAWTRLGSTFAHVELVVLADALCRRKAPISSPGRLADAVARLAPGARGVRRLRAALAASRAGTDSPMETRTRLALDAAGIVCEVNRPVYDEAGRFVAMPDLSDPVRRVAIEYDGDIHRTDKRVWRRDVARRQALEAAGWRVVTVTADDLLRGDGRWLAWVTAAQSRVTTPSGQSMSPRSDG
jgi:hypothetical protein